MKCKYSLNSVFALEEVLKSMVNFYEEAPILDLQRLIG